LLPKKIRFGKLAREFPNSSARKAHFAMTVFDLNRIRRETDLGHLEYHQTLDSTNQLAVQLLPDLQSMCPALVLTAQQTAGRGRGSNVWWASTGALTFSLVIDPVQAGIPTDRVPMLSLAVGTAVRRALQGFSGQADLRIKWPNDVLLNDRKVCGILIEQHLIDGRPVLIVGVGVNVNNSLQVAPADVRQRATSLFDETADSHDLSAVLIAVLQAIQACCRELVEQHAAWLSELNACSVLSGRVVVVQAGEQTWRGTCCGIDHRGALLLQTTTGTQAIMAGTVVDW
jgi:BirA family biotin operon repressor/biotin-[acetyl-CoA-carboxylase] ligase